MTNPRTAQQIADAAAKRRVTQAANKAAGLPTVRQARAAAKAARAGTPYTPPAPRPSFRRRRRSRFASSYAPPIYTPPVPQVVFTTPKPNYRALKLAALVALEAAFVQRLEDAGGVATLTDELRTAFRKYKSLKGIALAHTANADAQTEADSALRMATSKLVLLAY